MATTNSSSLLGTPAIRQILSRLNKSDKEEESLVNKIAGSCHKFDHQGKGKLTADEYFNVLKLQNGIDCSKEQVKKILSSLPADKDGRIKIQDFLHTDLHSEEAFKVLCSPFISVYIKKRVHTLCYFLGHW